MVYLISLSQLKCLAEPRETIYIISLSMVPRNVGNNHWKKIVSQSTGKFVLIIARNLLLF